ncbi:MAG: Gfo/Idh/MocA family oxidoreductase [Bacteroidota bacterium]|nr:Gfo/Idh/MocA family oxidoreductase [Bacteroidota bacterium]
MNKKTGWAIVGISKLVIDEVLPAFNLCKHAKLVALVSGDNKKAKSVAKQYGLNEKAIYNYNNFDDIKDNAEIDIVYIVLPNSQHKEFTVRAAKAGKHVLCEKPMATSADDAQIMIDACSEANKKLMIAYRIQYEPKNRRMMRWVRNEKYGKVRLLEGFNGMNIDDPEEWRLKKLLSGGGPLVDVGIYCINTFRFLLGEEPESVFATSYATPGDPRFKEVEESIMFQLRFPGGVIANAGTSYSVHASSRYRCLPDKNVWFGMDPAFPYNDLQIQLSEGAPDEEGDIQEKNQFALQLDHMSLCVMNDETPYTPGEEGLQDQKIIEAIYQSAREGRIVNLEKINKTDAFRGTPPKE